MIASVLKEYGIRWMWNRSLYALKLKMLCICPKTERIYEKNPEVKRLNIFNIDIVQLDSFLKQLPQKDIDQIICEADDAIVGRISGFSSVLLDYGNPIDWQLNPLTNQRVNERLKWYRIPDFDSTRGDIKVIWEISRFSHLVTFARAYLLTQNIKYYEAFSKQIAQWVQANSYSYGANYKCGQECSIRMVNVLLAYAIFKTLDLTTALDEQNVAEIVLGSYKKVLSNFFYAHKCIKNNHTISELMGMIIGAWCCGEDTRLDQAYRWLDTVVREQFTEDGGYTQYSFNYQRLALMDLNIIISLSKQIGKKINKESKQRIINSAYVLFQCQATNYDVPNYGSNDGALVFKLTSCGYRDFRAVCNSTFKLLCRKELYVPDKHQEELIWLGEYSNTSIKTDIVKQDLYCPQAGVFTLRNRHSMMMVICNDYKKRPGHMDQLHVDMWIDDVNVLCDCGTYSYATELGQKLIDSVSHNTITVDNRPQMSVRPPFLLYNWPKRVCVRKTDNSIQAKVKFHSGYIHERIIGRDEYGYVIEDKVTGCDTDEFCLRFHTVCEVETENDKIRLSLDGKPICYIKINAEYEISCVERSLYYMKKNWIYCISVRKNDDEEIITKIMMEDE